MFSCVTASSSSSSPPNTQVTVETTGSTGTSSSRQGTCKLVGVGLNLCLFTDKTLYSPSTVVTIPSYLLGTPITDQDIATIARDYLVRWEELSPHLELTVQQDQSIQRTFQEYENQKCEVLRTWKRNKGNGATYDSFITAAETISNMQLEDNVRVLLKKRLQHTPIGE